MRYPINTKERDEAERERVAEAAAAERTDAAIMTATAALRRAGVAENQIGRAMMLIEEGRFDEMRFSSDEKRAVVKAIYDAFWGEAYL